MSETYVPSDAGDLIFVQRPGCIFTWDAVLIPSIETSLLSPIQRYFLLFVRHKNI